MTSYMSPIPLFKPTMRFVSIFDDPPPLVSHKDDMIAQQNAYSFLPKTNVPIVINPSSFSSSGVLIPSRIASNAPFAPSYPPSNSSSNALFAPTYHLTNNSSNASFTPSYPLSNNSSNASFSTTYPPSNTTLGATFAFNDNISSATRRGVFAPMIPTHSKQELLDLCEKYELSKVGNKKKILKRLNKKGVFAKEANIQHKKLTWSQNSRNRELIEACRNRNLSIYGNKDELLQRLRDDEELRIENRIKGMATPQDDINPVQLTTQIFETMPTLSNEIQNKNTDEAIVKAVGATGIRYNNLAVVEKKLFPEPANENKEIANHTDDKNNGGSDDKIEQYGDSFNEVGDSNKHYDEDDEDKLVIDEDEVETYGGIFNEEQQHMNDNILDSQGDETMDEDSSNNSADNEDHHEENVEDDEGMHQANEDMAESEEYDNIKNINLPEENYYSDDNEENENIDTEENNLNSENDDDPGMHENDKLSQEDDEIELPDNEEELVYVSNANKSEDPEEEPTEDLKDNRSTFFAWGSFLGSGGTSEKVKFIS